MAKATVEMLVDDLDGSEASETIRLGWNGEWRELELSQKNLAALARAFDRYWNAGRPVGSDGTARRPSTRTRARRRSRKVARDPRAIRAWATENGITVPSRGRIPGGIEQQYNE